MAAAGNRAHRLHAPEEAVHYLKLAARRGNPVDLQRRAALLQALGEAEIQAGRPPEALAAWRESADLAAEADDPERVSALQHLLGLWEWEHGLFDKSESRLAQTLLQPSPHGADAAVHMVHLMIWTMRHGSASHLAATAGRMTAFNVPGSPAESASVRALGRCLRAMISGDFAAAAEEARESIREGSKSPNPMFAGTATRELGRIALLSGQMVEALDCARQNMLGAVRTGTPNVECSGRTALALMHHFAGQMAEALEQAALGAVAARRSASPRALARAALTEAWLQAELGQQAESRALLGDAQLIFADGLKHDAGLNSLDQLVRSALFLHQRDSQPVAPLETWSFESDPQILCLRPLFAGLVALSMQNIESCLMNIARLRETGRNSPVMQAFATRLEGLCAAADGRRSEAVRLLEQSATEQDRCGIRLYAAQTWTEWAELASEQGEPTALERSLAAVQLFDSQGITWWSDRGRRLARAMGARPPARKTTDGPLTRREAEVVSLVAAGLSNALIACQLFLSERTVETHMRHIYASLGLGTRMEVAAWARDNPGYVLPRMRPADK